MKPKAGDRGTYKNPYTGDLIGFTVEHVDGNKCFARYDDDKANLWPFIWNFKDGINSMHKWGLSNVSD